MAMVETLDELALRHQQAVDRALEVGDIEGAYRIQVAGAVAFSLVALRTAGFIPASYSPADLTEIPPFQQHEQLVSVLGARLDANTSPTAEAILGVRLLATALDLRRMLEEGQSGGQTWKLELSLTAAAFGEAWAHLRTMHERFFDEAASHRRSANIGSSNLKRRRSDQTWWHGPGAEEWRRVSEISPAPLIKVREGMVIARLEELAEGRPVPKPEAVKKVRLKSWVR